MDIPMFIPIYIPSRNLHIRAGRGAYGDSVGPIFIPIYIVGILGAGRGAVSSATASVGPNLLHTHTHTWVWVEAPTETEALLTAAITNH